MGQQRNAKENMGQQAWTTWIAVASMVLQAHETCCMTTWFNNGTWNNSATIMRSNSVMTGAAWCNMVRCNTMIGEGVTLENQLKT